MGSLEQGVLLPCSLCPPGCRQEAQLAPEVRRAIVVASACWGISMQGRVQGFRGPNAGQSRTSCESDWARRWWSLLLDCGRSAHAGSAAAWGGARRPVQPRTRRALQGASVLALHHSITEHAMGEAWGRASRPCSQPSNVPPSSRPSAAHDWDPCQPWDTRAQGGCTRTSPAQVQLRLPSKGQLLSWLATPAGAASCFEGPTSQRL